MILRAKTDKLIQTKPLTSARQYNTAENTQEMKAGETLLKSKPQRFVFEMTNACNLNCVMCGRNAKHFRPAHFNINWLKKFEPVAESVEEITLMGWGEPTMHPQFIDFLKWAENFGLRKYFCTNGIKLGELMPAIFEYKVDVIAVSMDAANHELNNAIRRGADFNVIVNNLKSITSEKKHIGTPWPYMNFVTTLMKKNLHEFPKIVQLAADIGLDEVKGVFLTVFDEAMANESLYNSMDEVREVFDEAYRIASDTGVKLKIPHLCGEDSAGDAYHKPCYTAWRDFFLGSDGYVRPCMSTPLKFFHIDHYETFDEMWNSVELIDFRKNVNEDSAMNVSCKRCYQSSFANWNRKSSFYQVGLVFSPEWGGEGVFIIIIPPPPPPP
jgi:radical SAM protein with 4Fe4S-binding SPASM domain